MTVRTTLRLALVAALAVGVSGCGGRLGEMIRRTPAPNPNVPPERVDTSAAASATSTIWDLFENRDDPNTTLGVNRYIWTAALEVLNFLPVESVDPFSGVIVMGYGVPPGGGRPYRATVYVQDVALDARSLKVALEARGGAVPDATVRAIEDAILTRARQLRIRDRRL